MGKSNKTMLKRFAVFVLIISLLVFPFVLNNKAQAAPHTVISDQLSRLEVSLNANHTITFTLASAWDASEALTLDFVDGDGFDTTGFANTEPEDFDIRWGGSGGTEKTIVDSVSCAANSIAITTADTTNDTFVFTLCAGSTASGANEIIEI